MLETVTFDTHQVFEVLSARGYTKEQAQGFVDAIKELNLHKLATKEDLNRELLATREDFNRGLLATREDFTNEFKLLRLEIEKMEMRIVIKLGSLVFLLGGFLVAIKFLS